MRKVAIRFVLEPAPDDAGWLCNMFGAKLRGCCYGNTFKEALLSAARLTADIQKEKEKKKKPTRRRP